MWRNSTARYGSLQIGLHWLTLLVLAGVYAAMESREFFPKGSDTRNFLKDLHYMLGITVLALRLAARLSGPTPAIDPPPARWQNFLARLVHLALYAFMLGMPLAGWLMRSAEGDPVPFYGFELPALIGPDKALAESIEELHVTVGELGYYLIGLHAAAALYHHYLVKDNTLARMLGSASRKRH
jgi:superoxide oxidase